jgi:hypothetical protein
MSYGSDFAAIDDLDAALTFLEGPEDEILSVRNALSRRLDTERGALWYSSSYGLKILQFLVDSINPRVAESAIENEVLKDDRIQECSVKITIDPETQEWRIAINPVLGDGSSLNLVFSASPEKVSLL